MDYNIRITYSGFVGQKGNNKVVPKKETSSKVVPSKNKPNFSFLNNFKAPKSKVSPTFNTAVRAFKNPLSMVVGTGAISVWHTTDKLVSYAGETYSAFTGNYDFTRQRSNFSSGVNAILNPTSIYSNLISGSIANRNNRLKAEQMQMLSGNYAGKDL